MPNRREAIIYYPEATCTYAVADVSLPSSETTLTHAIPIHKNFSGFSGKRKAEQWLEDHYSVDMLLIIYYNPDNPKQAVLQPEILFSWTRLLFLASAGIVFMFCGSVLLLAYFGTPKLNFRDDLRQGGP
jgi:hypothetical protein